MMSHRTARYRAAQHTAHGTRRGNALGTARYTAWHNTKARTSLYPWASLFALVRQLRWGVGVLSLLLAALRLDSFPDVLHGLVQRGHAQNLGAQQMHDLQDG